MIITIFKNKKGMIHGPDSKRIESKIDGVLKIGSTQITVSSKEESILPLLFYGSTGKYSATFTDVLGKVYDLGKITISAGRIAPPTPTEVELMELRCRADAAEDERNALAERIRVLENIFDTDALNFLIK